GARVRGGGRGRSSGTPGQTGIRTPGGGGLEPAHRVPGRGGVNADGFADPVPTATFADELPELPFDRLLDLAHDASDAAVRRALSTPALERTLEDGAALLSPAAGLRLEDLA